jgi:lipopolysaccharide/colanic/teichoic acid biosynthesis glycosyltransferase
VSKRVFDVVVSATALLIGAPVLLAVALAVRLTAGSPVLFVQERPGLHGKSFKILKFRTMRHALDEDGRLLPDEARLTRAGRFIRATSLDELPSLWNVLRGDMSIVGPRPLLVDYLPLYSPEQARRHDVKPGLTGWAQVNGRNAISWEDKFRMDVWYVENQSLRLDLRIVWMTLSKVLRSEGINQPGHATMERFKGSE